jgi:hypothetical protein
VQARTGMDSHGCGGGKLYTNLTLYYDFAWSW